MIGAGSVNWMPLVFDGSSVQVGHQFGVYTQFYAGLANGTIGSYISVAASNPLPTGGSSSMSVNGTITQTPGNVGFNGIGTTNKLTMGGNDAGGGQLIGYVYEVLIKAGKKDATEQAALCIPPIANSPSTGSAESAVWSSSRALCCLLAATAGWMMSRCRG